MLGVAQACVQRPQKDLGFLLYALNFIPLRQDLSLNMEQGCAQQTRDPPASVPTRFGL